MKIAGVRFRDNSRVYDFDATGVDLSVGDAVIVESDRGQGFARVVRLREADALPPLPLTTAEQKSQKAQDGGKKGNGEEEEIEIEVETPGSLAKPKPPARGHRTVLRRATEDDLRRADKNTSREAEAFQICQDMIAERELAMKLIRAEFSFDASRVTFSFFSETRIDFRELVKDLAHKLRCRIEMRQVGVRDVARIIGGFGPCGRELCCTSFLRGFEPVSIRMAKKQEMVLNPAKISGVCGRLLCCLSYEYAMYDEIKKDVAGMKEEAAREKREEQERRITEERREAEERRQEDDRKLQEQRQRDKQRAPEQKDARKQEPRREGPKDQKQRPPQEQRPQDRQPARQPGPEQQAPPAPQQAAEQGEKTGGKRKRRFWRKKKKKGGGQQPGGGGGGAPAGGGA